jgi:CyaY protein
MRRSGQVHWLGTGADAALGAGAALGRVRGPFWPQAVKQSPAERPSAQPSFTGADKLVRPLIIKIILASMTDSPDRKPLTDAEYHRLSAALLASVEALLDEWLQSDLIDIDSARTGGMLEMSFPNASKIVINTQPPLHEIWLAARSGGHHFKCRNGAWVDTKDGRDFFDALSACASEQAGMPLRFVAR